MLDNIFGKNLKRLRKNATLKQRTLANMINVHNSSISDWERGKTEPDLDMVKQLARILDATYQDLMD